MGLESEAAYRATVTDGPENLADLLQAMRAFLGQSDMMAYLAMMAPRIAELHRVLKPTGSIYLHCDPTASHYYKAADGRSVWAKEFLREREVVWFRTITPHRVPDELRFAPGQFTTVICVATGRLRSPKHLE